MNSILRLSGGLVDEVPVAGVRDQGRMFKMGQTRGQAFPRPLLGRIEEGHIELLFGISHGAPIDQAPFAYRALRDKHDECFKAVLKPSAKDRKRSLLKDERAWRHRP